MKSICAYCNEVTECSCPEGSLKHVNEAKFVCEVCMELLSMGVKEQDLKTTEKRAEVKLQLETNEVAELLAETAVQVQFEEIWNREKESLRNLSKKELAKEAFFQGLHTGIESMIIAHREGELDELISDTKEELHKADVATKQPKIAKT